MTSRDRLALAILTGVAFALVTIALRPYRFQPSDLGPLLDSARELRAGRDPYAAIGPGGTIGGPFRLNYPLPAAIAIVPLSFVPLAVADPIFVGLGAFALAWVLVRHDAVGPRFLIFGSLPFIYALQTSQWSPLLTAAALTPAFGALLVCKPNLGLALLAGFPSRKTAVGCAVFGLASVIAFPWWPPEWLRNLSQATHFIAPIRRPGGFLVLLALWRWRRPEARLLVALACAPQTPQFYDTVPLFLLVETWTEGAVLTLLGYAAGAATLAGAPYASYDVLMSVAGNWTTWLIYLPCTALVLWQQERRR
jgi:hypothetical protein